MRYGQSNGIGSFLAIAMGISAFAAWLYVCYPTTANELADESRQSWSFLVLVGFIVIAIIGATIAGSILHGVMMLLRSLVQLSLIIAVVVGGVMLWRREPAEYQLQPAATRYQEVSPPPQVIKETPPKPSSGRWWDKK